MSCGRKSKYQLRSFENKTVPTLTEPKQKSQFDFSGKLHNNIGTDEP